MDKPRGSTKAATATAGEDQPAPESLTWEGFEDRLVGVLGRMATDTYLILSTPDTGDAPCYYVQFAQGGKAGLLAEAVSNDYLEGAGALSPAQEEQLGDLGWQWPHPHSKTDRNFSRQWPMPAPFGEVAHLAVRTLREVYGIERPSRLVYRRFARAGSDFAEPELGIDAEPPSTPRRMGTPGAPTLADLAPLVEAALKKFLHVDDLHRDQDGDIPVRMGSAIVFVRTLDGTPPMVQVFSPILRGVQRSPALLGALNELNAKVLLGRVFWTGRAVVVATEVPAVGLTSDHIGFTCLQLGSLADRLDDDLRDRFGGRTALDAGRQLVN
jgi:hypothetical protein